MKKWSVSVGFIALVIIVALILCLSVAITSLANKSEQLDATGRTEEEQALYDEALNQYEAIVLYGKLMTAFIDQYGIENGQPACYPEDYAGAYVNEDGKLVIQITNMDNQKMPNPEVYARYSNYIGLTEIKEKDTSFKYDDIKDIVIFVHADYSLNELYEMLSYSVRMVSEQFEQFPILEFYVDTLNNTVNIALDPTVYDNATLKQNIYTSTKSFFGKEIPLVFEVGESR